MLRGDGGMRVGHARRECGLVARQFVDGVRYVDARVVAPLRVGTHLGRERGLVARQIADGVCYVTLGRGDGLCLGATTRRV